ncbi:hypothetical protein Dsin_029460 [Dipteronia sinensis]|uniref:Uncharacterized protein n=1 Tax=Dipteronia sinensis TaxID=43782 RepID=A0AAD9ZT48_9ROSI|nr:hypothetical protein Dsin_029460 [Dipteronia sinensis]
MDPMTGSGPSQASGSGTSGQAKAEKDGGDDTEEGSLFQVGDPPAGRNCNTSKISGSHVGDGNLSLSTMETSLPEDAPKHPLAHQMDELDTKNNLSNSYTVQESTSSAPGERPEDYKHCLGEPQEGQNPIKHRETEASDKEISSASGHKPADECSLDGPKHDQNPLQRRDNEEDSSAAPDNKTVVISSENIGEKRADNHPHVDELAEEDPINPLQHETKELNDHQEQDSSTPDNRTSPPLITSQRDISANTSSSVTADKSCPK